MPSRLRQLVADPAAGYVLRALGWFLFFLGALRLPWVQSSVLVPFALLQARAAAMLRGEELQVLVSSSCTGSDAIAVCLGAVLAFPVAWQRRLLAAGGGFVVISAFNTVRIGHLSGLADRPELLGLWHHRVWPALIILVAAGYAFWWMRSASAAADEAPGSASRRPTWRLPAVPFLTLATALVAVYYLAYERLLTSPLLAAVANGAAATAGGLMSLSGVTTRVGGGVLQMADRAWIVTPECVTTPIIPLFLAAALTLRAGWWTRLGLVAATPVLFFLLGIGRLMVVALPPALVGSRYIAVHAFYQALLAVLGVIWLARRRGGDVVRRVAAAALGVGAAIGLAVGILDMRAIRPLGERLGAGLHLGHGYSDDQGALLLLPAFGLGLTAAIWIASRRPGGWRSLALASGLVAAGGLLLVVIVGELAEHLALLLPVVAIRLASLALPAGAAWALGWVAPHRSSPEDPPLRESPSLAA